MECVRAVGISSAVSGMLRAERVLILTLSLQPSEGFLSIGAGKQRPSGVSAVITTHDQQGQCYSMHSVTLPHLREHG